MSWYLIGWGVVIGELTWFVLRVDLDRATGAI
jgi:hypothetical protein